MTRLPDPQNTACAIARVIRARAHSISDLGDQIATISDPMAVTPEEWVVLTNSLRKLAEELSAEIEAFALKAAFSA
jgi:hypothetical protein